MNFSSEFFVKLRSLLLTALMRVPSTASNSRPNRSSSRHSSVNWRNTARKAAAIVAPEVGDGLEVRLQGSQQPDDLDVAMAFGLQPPARPHPVQIAVDVELQQIARRVAGAARRLRRDAREPGRREIEPVNEGVDEPNGIVGADIIVDRLRQQQKLRTFESGNVSHVRF